MELKKSAFIYPFISLVIPCYNEQERITQMMSGIKDFLCAWHGAFEFIIVDDGSTDETKIIIERNLLYQNLLADKRIKLITQNNTGKGGAISKGIQESNGEYILTLDADMATNPLEIINWAITSKATFGGTTITIASRTLANSELILISNRRNSGKLFNSIVRKITGLPFLDTQCGFKLYPSKTAKNLFANLKTKGWAHDVEILLKAYQQNIPIIEMPITWNEQAASKINVVRDGIKMLIEVLRIKFFLKTKRREMLI